MQLFEDVFCSFLVGAAFVLINSHFSLEL